MKMRRLSLAAVFFGCSIILCGCGSAGGGGGGVGNLFGTVVDLGYNPVSNADVVVDSAATKTLSNGRYSFINLPSGVKIIKINSVAHTSSYRKVTFSGGTSANAGIAVVADLDSKVTPISSSGGTATNTTGSIKMVFPSGAFSTTTNVVLTTVPKVAAPFNPPEGDQFVSYIIFAKPDNVTLGAPAKLSIPNLTQVPSTVEVNFYKFNTDTLAWDLLPGVGHSTPETGTIDFSTNQMGWIAAIMQIFPAPGWIQGTVTSGGAPVSGANVWTTTNYDVSNSSGSYKLTDIPVGTAEVFASALGYSLYTSPVQTITSGNQTTLNIDLAPLVQHQGNITGTVKDLFGGALNPARIVESNGGVAYTDQSGIYTLYNVPVGLTNVSAYADNYISSTEPVTVISGSTVTQNYRLIPVGQSSTYEFTFETSAEGFITKADRFGHNFWHRQAFDDLVPSNNPQNYFNFAHSGGIAQKVFLRDDGVTSVNGRIPVPHEGSHYFWYGQTSQVGDPSTSEASYIGLEAGDDTVEGSGGISAFGQSDSGTLESPDLDLRGYTFGKLSFWTWWEIEGKNPATGFDSMKIYASISSSNNWDLIGVLNPYDDPAKTLDVSGEAYTSGGFNQPGIWVQHNFDLSKYAGKVIKLMFVFDTHDNLYNGFRGWFIDDIKVESTQFGISSLGEKVNRRPPTFRREPRN